MAALGRRFDLRFEISDFKTWTAEGGHPTERLTGSTPRANCASGLNLRKPLPIGWWAWLE